MRWMLLLFACLFFVPFQLMAQPGALIPGFGTGGMVTSSGASFIKIGVQPSGKIIVCRPGSAGTEILRYNADGTQDLQFGGSTYGYVFFGRMFQAFWFAKDMAIQPDGGIILLGAANGTDGSSTLIFRLNENGTTDASFGSGGWTTADITGFKYFTRLTVDAAGKIIATGSYEYNANDLTKLMVAKFNADGTPDLTFNGGGTRIVVDGDGYDHMGRICKVDGNGSITVLEEVAFSSYRLRRFLSNGNLDLGFGTSGQRSAEPMTDMDVDATGRIAYLRSSLHILNSNGSTAGTYTLPAIARVLRFQADGKILVAGQKNSNGHTNFWLYRHSDASFGNNGEVVTDFSIPSEISDIDIYNRRIYAGGLVRVPNVELPFGAIAVYDGSDARLTCPTPQNPYTVDAGKCYATINNINPVMSSSTLWANVQNSVEHNGTTTTGEGGVSGQTFQLGTTNITYTYTDITTQTCSFSLNVYDGDPPVARCKNLTIPLDATGNATVTVAQVDNGSTDGCGIQSRSLSKTAFDCSNVGANTVMLTITDVHGNTATCSATVTVQDNTAPVARCKNKTAYLDANGSVSITAADIDNGSSDACGSVSLSLDKTSFGCADKGANTVVLTVTDPNNNTATCSATVTVLDTLPPVISSVVASPSSLWPSDRKMKAVTITTASTDNCPGHSCRITDVAIKSGEFANDNINPDWEITGDNTVNLRAEILKNGVKRIYTVTVTCTDESGNTSTASTDVMVSYNITAPGSGGIFRVGSSVNLSGEFWDLPGKTHSAKWLIDDNTTVRATLTEPSGNSNGTVTGSYKFNSAGVYKLQMNVTDQDGVTHYANTNEKLDAIIVVYDPNGGYTYGGGSFSSPAGALNSQPDLAGDVSFGFTLNYFKSATLPKGETQFNFSLGDFEYNALNFDYLAISGAKAQFRGTGRIIGGQSGISFIMTVIDGQLDGTGVDKVRMKIFNKKTGQVFYDNQPGASDAADPLTAVGANSGIVISNDNAAITVSRQKSREELNQSGQLAVMAFPNPYTRHFSLRIHTPVSGLAVIEFFTALGTRIYQVKKPVSAGAENILRFSDLPHNGILMYRVSVGGRQVSGRVVDAE